jgi:hypothetical protein
MSMTQIDEQRRRQPIFVHFASPRVQSRWAWLCMRFPEQGQVRTIYGMKVSVKA